MVIRAALPLNNEITDLFEVVIESGDLGAPLDSPALDFYYHRRLTRLPSQGSGNFCEL